VEVVQVLERRLMLARGLWVEILPSTFKRRLIIMDNKDDVICFSDSGGDEFDQTQRKEKLMNEYYTSSYDRNEHCQNCYYSHYYNDRDVDTVQCKRYPPVLNISICESCKEEEDFCDDNCEDCYERWDYPVMFDLFWCGEWKLKIKNNSKSGDEELKKLFLTKIDETLLNGRIKNALRYSNIFTIGDLVLNTREDIHKYRNMGRVSYLRIKSYLEGLGLAFDMKKEVERLGLN
jgi:hypothetical protein